MGRVKVEAQVTARFRGINRDTTEPGELGQRVREKLEAALRTEDAEIEVRVQAEDG